MKTSIVVWYREALKSAWASPSIIKEKYRNVSFLKNNKVIFHIHGNKYR
ncbi:type II toxin-antitoxin system HigB family toxin [Leptospira weilii]|uniref:PF09907 family protein n=1 Tax=Leptospira weilii str. Ecochallenge TaxID=1049986 RepID=N1U4B7_9LEPT|nr:type II toxin-antitoxin system HigB family toxin [Leptospira weilii]EMY13867.1 PF09907 family protein [Leptospira weilii str. Ecochallenge]MCL8266223.1 type II toxin-antitoxin system HigB family toxin [Leptospira weilii]